MAVAVDSNVYLVVVFQFAIGLLGISLNAPIVYLTIKNKELHRMSSLLLAEICFCDFIYGFGGILSFVTMTGGFQIALRTCLFLQYHSVIISVSINLMFFLGLERLLAVLFPIWHSQRQKKSSYAIIIFVLCLIKYLIYFIILYGQVEMTSDKMVFCQSADFLQGFGYTYISGEALIMNIATTILYALLWATIRKNRNKLQSNDGVNQRVTKSISVILFLNLIFWLNSILFGTFIFPNVTFLANNLKLFLSTLLIQLCRFATTLNAPVLFVCSSEYRELMLKEVRSLRKAFRFSSKQIQIDKQNHSIIGRGNQTTTMVNNFIRT